MTETETLKHIYVDWIHESSDNPYLIVAELDETNLEVRKVEFFTNGEVHQVSRMKLDSGPTALSMEPWPSTDEINMLSPREFQAKEITLEEFEHLWGITYRSKS